MSHDKGRDCARTDEVLEHYRRRAMAAETELSRLKGIPLVASEQDDKGLADVQAILRAFGGDYVPQPGDEPCVPSPCPPLLEVDVNAPSPPETPGGGDEREFPSDRGPA